MTISIDKIIIQSVSLFFSADLPFNKAEHSSLTIQAYFTFLVALYCKEIKRLS